MLKLEALRVFVTVAELGNIKDASSQLGRTASAISMTLKQIEIDIGGPLFESERKNALTALGAYVLDTGREQVRAFDKAIGSIRAFADSRIGKLTLASVPSVAANVIPPLLQAFIAERPGVEIELIDTDSRNVSSLVEKGIADFGIAGQPSDATLVDFTPLFADRFKLICQRGSRLAKLGQAVQWSDLENETFIMNGAIVIHDIPEFRKLAERASINVRNVTSLNALVRGGLGVTLLPALATTDMPHGVVALDLDDDRIRRQVGFVTSSNTTLSPAAKSFHDYALKNMRSVLKSLGLGST